MVQGSGNDRTVKPGIAEYLQVGNGRNAPAIEQFPVICSPHFFKCVLVDPGLRSHGTDIEDDATVKFPAVRSPEKINRIAA